MAIIEQLVKNMVLVENGISLLDIYDIKTAKYLEDNIKLSKLYPIKDAVHTSLITFSTSETFKQISNFLLDYK